MHLFISDSKGALCTMHITYLYYLSYIIGYPKKNDNGTKYGQFLSRTKIRYHSVDFQ